MNVYCGEDCSRWDGVSHAKDSIQLIEVLGPRNSMQNLLTSERKAGFQSQLARIALARWAANVTGIGHDRTLIGEPGSGTPDHVVHPARLRRPSRHKQHQPANGSFTSHGHGCKPVCDARSEKSITPQFLCSPLLGLEASTMGRYQGLQDRRHRRYSGEVAAPLLSTEGSCISLRPFPKALLGVIDTDCKHWMSTATTGSHGP